MSEEWNFLYNLPSTLGRYIVFDTETTGLIPKYDQILEIAATEIINGKSTGNQFHVFIKPRTKIKKEATEFNKMDNDFYKNFYENVFENEKQLLLNFLRFVNNSLIFAHNAIFDFNFINKELEFHNLPTIPKEKFRCTMRIVKKFTIQNKINSYTLEKCAEHFEIQTNKNKLHSGIYDAEICAKLLIKIFDKYNMNEKTNISANSNNTIENCLKHLNNQNPNTLNYNLNIKDKKNLDSVHTVPYSVDRTVKDLKTGLLTTFDESNTNFSGKDINDDEFESQRELSILSEFDNLSLVYTDSKATTNTLDPNIEMKNPKGIQKKYDDKIKVLTDINRSYVINTLNDVSVNKVKTNPKRKEFEDKIDRDKFREQFENLNK